MVRAKNLSKKNKGKNIGQRVDSSRSNIILITIGLSEEPNKQSKSGEYGEFASALDSSQITKDMISYHDKNTLINTGRMHIANAKLKNYLPKPNRENISNKRFQIGRASCRERVYVLV